MVRAAAMAASSTTRTNSRENCCSISMFKRLDNITGAAETGRYNTILIAIPPVLLYLLLLTVAGGAAGIWLAEIPALARRVVPFSGGLVVGVALFRMLPAVAAESGWPWVV